MLRQRGIPPAIPERRDQRAHRTAKPGRPLAFATATYARRDVVVGRNDRRKQWRILARTGPECAAHRSGERGG
jgi:hypothetical protein